MRNVYEKELEKLIEKINNLGTCCHDALDDAMVFIENTDKVLYDKIILYREQSLSQKQIIESKCYQLILEQQPIASDLRIISSALKVASDLDRINEQVYDIVHLASGIQEVSDHIHKNLMTMFALVENLLADCMEAYLRKNASLARQVMKRDDLIDDAFISIKNQLIVGIRNSEVGSDEYIDVLLITKYLEKIADHIVNVAKQTIFLVTAQVPLEEGD